MADFQYGQLHANTSTAVTATGYESLTSHFEFITIEMAADLRSISQGGGSAGSQAALDKLIQIVSTRGQPVLMGPVNFSSPNSIVMLAIEHQFAWSAAENTTTLGVAGFVDPRTSENLGARIVADGINFTFPTPTITFNGTLTTPAP